MLKCVDVILKNLFPALLNLLRSQMADSRLFSLRLITSFLEIYLSHASLYSVSAISFALFTYISYKFPEIAQPKCLTSLLLDTFFPLQKNFLEMSTLCQRNKQFYYNDIIVKASC